MITQATNTAVKPMDERRKNLAEVDNLLLGMLAWTRHERKAAATPGSNEGIRDVLRELAYIGDAYAIPQPGARPQTWLEAENARLRKENDRLDGLVKCYRGRLVALGEYEV